MVEVQVDKKSNVTVFAIDGEFYIESVEYAEKIWNEIVADKPEKIAIDCSKIKYIDSSAIGMLVKFRNVSIKNDIELLFFDISEPVEAIFKTAHLDQFFTTLSLDEFNLKFSS